MSSLLPVMHQIFGGVIDHVLICLKSRVCVGQEIQKYANHGDHKCTLDTRTAEAPRRRTEKRHPNKDERHGAHDRVVAKMRGHDRDESVDSKPRDAEPADWHKKDWLVCESLGVSRRRSSLAPTVEGPGPSSSPDPPQSQTRKKGVALTRQRRVGGKWRQPSSLHHRLSPRPSEHPARPRTPAGAQRRSLQWHAVRLSASVLLPLVQATLDACMLYTCHTHMERPTHFSCTKIASIPPTTVAKPAKDSCVARSSVKRAANALSLS